MAAVKADNNFRAESNWKLESGWLCLDFANTAEWHASDHPIEPRSNC